MKQLSPSETVQYVEDALRSGQIPYVSGPPGIGKSDIMQKIADMFGLLLIDIRLSQMLPEDLTGLPQIDPKTGRATYTPFDLFPMEGDPVPEGYNGWLIFLDELSSASEEVMAASYGLLLGHRVGNHKIHPKARIAAAGNRSTDSAIARPLPDTIITRVLPCEMKVSVKDWVKWNQEENPQRNDHVGAYIEKNPDMLLGQLDPDKREELETYPTPRGWGKAMSVLNMHEKRSKKQATDSAGIPIDGEATSALTDSVKQLMSAAVGHMASQSFFEYYAKTLTIPAPWEVAGSPNGTVIPPSAIGRSKLTNDLAAYYKDAPAGQRKAILTFMNRMDKEHAAMFVETLKTSLGETASSMEEIENAKKRLGLNLTFAE